MSSPHLLEDCPRLPLSNPSQWSLSGHSRAGERTGLWLHPLRLALDAGVVTRRAPAAVILSHSHYDHTSALPQLVYRSRGQLQPPGQEGLCGRPVVMPREAEAPVQRLMEGVMALSRGEATTMERMPREEVWRVQGYHPIPVSQGDQLTIPGLDRVRVRVLAAYHTAPSLGYGLSTIKRKLRREWRGADKEEILAARKAGEEVTEEVLVPELAFFCDSTVENLTLHQEWKEYPVVVVECTGYPSHHTTTSHVGHTHLSQLEEVMVEGREKHWVLIHASTSLRDQELAREEARLRSRGVHVDILRDSLAQQL